jgi:hypothetical protein
MECTLIQLESRPFNRYYCLSRNAIQCLFGKINFCDDLFLTSKQAFEDIKFAFFNAPVLVSLIYSKPLQIFSFALEFTYVVILLQKDENGFERPLAFTSKSLQGAKC